jgi:hypothetical protein
MTRRPIDEQLITDFLLGNLPEEEIERLDEMSLADDDFANRLQTVENDLIDAYVRGELSGTHLAQFESAYLRSPKRQEKVAFAESLQKLTKRSSITPKHQTIYTSRWLAAAAAVVLITVSYLIFENMRLHNDVEKLKAEKRSFQQHEQELQKQLAQHEHQRPTQKQPDTKLMAFLLLPQTRGISKIPLIQLPADTDFLALTLKLDTNDFPNYVALLRNPITDETVWQSEKIKAEDNNSVQVRIPASLFKPQNYLMELSGISSKGSAEIVNSYPFRIAIQ